MAALNVLALLDSLHATDADGAVTNRKWPEAQEARAAVADLIEAAGDGREMACDDGRNAIYFSPNLADRLRAALARCGAGA